jgi:2-octaprenyl-6-methoxyphenol hydroxylase
MLKKSCDILIIGGGLVGLSLAKGLEQLNLSYYLVDPCLGSKSTLVDIIPRALALSKTSLAILRHLGLDYRELHTCPIQKIQVSCEHSWGKLYLDEPKHEFLGQVINLHELQETLLAQIEQPSSLISGRFHHYCPQSRRLELDVDGELIEMEAKLIIAADGAESPLRQACQLPLEIEKDGTAVLAFLDLAQPHQGLAFERFTAAGPLALLPWDLQSYALVFGMDEAMAETVLAAGEPALVKMLKQQFGTYLSELKTCRGMKSYPLKQVFMPKQQFQSILFLGNAAHTLHPVAGQGFNLSLRDVAVLLDGLEKYGLGPELLPIYGLNRQDDQRMTQVITQFLASGMKQISGKLPSMAGLGLSLAEHCPGVKDIFGFYAQGLGYPLPTWVYEHLEHIYE